MGHWRAFTVIASAPFIGFITTAWALTLDLPQTIDVASAFNDPDDVGFVNTSLIQANVSGFGLSYVQYQCFPDYGRPLPVACRFAQWEMSDSTRVLSWGQRSNPIASDVRLPFRTSSGRKTTFMSELEGS